MDKSLFERIFSDAHVVDVDLSRWDKSIDLYVLADHLPRVDDGRRLPLFLIRFLDVKSMTIQRSGDLPQLKPNEHVHWMLDDMSIQEGMDGFVIELWGFETSPSINMRCADVQIEQVDLALFDRLFPGWDAPERGLARPGPVQWRALTD